MAIRPRLLLIAPYFFPQNYGGAVQIYDGLLRRFKHFDVTVLTQRQLDDAVRLREHDTRFEREHGYRIVRVPRLVFHLRSGDFGGLFVPFIEYAKFRFDLKRAFKQLLAEWRPNVVICGATFSTGWMMKHVGDGILRANYIHGEELTMRRDGGRLDRRSIGEQREALRSADLNLVVSQYTAETLQRVAGIGPERIELVSNAVDTRRFSPPADRNGLRARLGWQGRTVLLTVARLIARKGVDQVLRALAARQRAGELPADWLYCIGGKGPEEVALMRLTNELKLEERVQFLGYLENEALPELYGAADLFVLTNREVAGDTEGFGIVFIEANACGTPVLGGLAGGTAEAIAEGVSGYRVDGDDAEAIGAKLVELLGDPHLRESLAAGGLARAQRDFDVDRRAERLEQLLLQKVDAQRPRRA